MCQAFWFNLWNRADREDVNCVSKHVLLCTAVELWCIFPFCQTQSNILNQPPSPLRERKLINLISSSSLPEAHKYSTRGERVTEASKTREIKSKLLDRYLEKEKNSNCTINTHTQPKNCQFAFSLKWKIHKNVSIQSRSTRESVVLPPPNYHHRWKMRCLRAARGKHENFFLMIFQWKPENFPPPLHTSSALLLLESISFSFSHFQLIERFFRARAGRREKFRS